MNPKTVSAVIPAFNAEKCISRAIKSVLNQTVCPDEIIVVNDGSTDNTATEVKKFGDRVVYIEQENEGPARARNVGIEAATCEWIAFLDADDEWHPDKQEIQLQLLDKNPHLRWCGGNAFNSNGDVTTYRSSPQKAQNGLKGLPYFDSYLDAVGNGHIIEATITLMFHREVFENAGMFEPRFLRVEDSDMWSRIAFEYPRFGYITDPLATVHLNIANPILQKRRIEAKRGVIYRQVVRKNMPLATTAGCLEDYKKYARWLLGNSLLQTLFHGYKEDARETVDDFPEIFPSYWRSAVYALTVFPGLTSKAAKTAIKLYSKTMGEKRITRRWTDHS